MGRTSLLLFAYALLRSVTLSAGRAAWGVPRNNSRLFHLCWRRRIHLTQAELWEHARPHEYPVESQNYLQLLALSLSGALNYKQGIWKHRNMVPIDRLCGNDWPLYGYTMVGLVRLRNLADLVHRVVLEDVPGAFAETGVWRGGSCIYVKGLFNSLGVQREIYLFDSFAPMAGYSEATQFLAVSEDNVRDNFKEHDLYDDNVQFFKGLFKHTLPEFYQNYSTTNLSISILRIDGNYYDSHQDALYYLYEFVPVGGYVVFDDLYNYPEAMRSWQEFKADQDLVEEPVPIDRSGAYFKKQRSITVNFGKKRPTMDEEVR